MINTRPATIALGLFLFVRTLQLAVESFRAPNHSKLGWAIMYCILCAATVGVIIYSAIGA